VARGLSVVQGDADYGPLRISFGHIRHRYSVADDSSHREAELCACASFCASAKT
jgi:hypothetical protein